MAAIIGSLRAELSASIAQFQSDMGQAADAVKKFAGEAKKVARELTETGTQMSVALSLPLIALGREAVKAANEAAAAQTQLRAAIASTGNASGRTAEQLDKSADALKRISTFDKDDILRNVTTNLLTFGNVQGEVFDRAQLAIVNLSARLGQDLQSATIKVGRSLQDPIKGMAALTKLGISFTDAQKNQIKELVRGGDGMKAQGIILDALASKFDGAAAAARKASPTADFNNAWRDFLEVVGADIIPLLKDVTEMLAAVLEAFNSLSPGMQKFVVVFLAVVAVIGPLLVEIGTLIKLLSTLANFLAPVMKLLAGLELATVGWVVALAAVALAVVIFWKSIKDILHGDFTKAWEDAQATAKKIAANIKGLFSGTTEGAGAGAAAAAGGAGGKPGKPVFNQDNEAEIKKAAQAAQNFQAAIVAMNQKIANGLGQLTLPKATTQAAQLNAEIDAFVLKAKEAGVKTDRWAAQIGSMRDRIEEFKKAGLQKEAGDFAQAVDQDAIAVGKFARGGLPELQEKLQGIDDQYLALHDKITDQITANEALAGSNDDAAATMVKLKGVLAELEKAHTGAKLAAESQYWAEQGLVHLQAERNKAQTRNDIEDIHQAMGQGGPLSQNQQSLQNTRRQLEQQLIEAESKYFELVKERQEIEVTGNEQQKADLETEIELQREYADLVASTSAEQLEAARKMDEAFKSFADSISQDLMDMLANWDGSLKGLMSTFRQLAQQLFIKPVTDSIGEGLSGFTKKLFQGSGGGIGEANGGGDFIGTGSGGGGGFLSSLAESFGGMFASGGSLNPGEWGIAGENGPEPIFGGRTGLTVVANNDPTGGMQRGGGVVVNQYISTPDANSFRASRRQVARQVKEGLAA